MRGIESAFFGTLGRDPELRTSRNGNPYLTLSIAVTVGRDDAGKDVTQWVRVTCFGETAQQLATTARKGDRLYAEGSLTLNTWTTNDGQARADLQVSAWKREKLGAIGRNRPRHDTGERQQASPQDERFALSDEIPFLTGGSHDATG
jgi:single-strand DNA-binding protein